MKEKMSINSYHPFEQSFQAQCWISNKRNRPNVVKRLFKRYQSEIDRTLAATIIGGMFLIGIWCFLVQLAEY